MGTFFHMEFPGLNGRLLEPGQLMQAGIGVANPEQLQWHDGVLRALFPGGLAHYGTYVGFVASPSVGQHSMWSLAAQHMTVQRLVELCFELVRREFYPDKPSRLGVVFGWGSVEDALTSAGRYGHLNVGSLRMPVPLRIWEVEAEAGHIGDGRLGLLFDGNEVDALASLEARS